MDTNLIRNFSIENAKRILLDKKYPYYPDEIDKDLIDRHIDIIASALGFKTNVYANCDLYEPNGNVNKLSIENLNPRYKKWINKTILELNEKSPIYENDFCDILKYMLKNQIRTKCTIITQAAFVIDKKSYFLDVYIPELKIAYEIDGSSHKERNEYDEEKDKRFRYIGINIIRISAKDVYRKDDIQRIISTSILQTTINIHVMNNEFINQAYNNKYEREFTFNQKVILYFLNKLEKVKDDSNVYVATNLTYLIGIISNEYGTKNVKFIERYITIKERKNLTVNCGFSKTKITENDVDDKNVEVINVMTKDCPDFVPSREDKELIDQY